MLSRERPDSSCDLSQASSMTRTLVRVADGTVALREPVANGVEHLLAAGGEVVDPLASADAGAGDQAVPAGQGGPGGPGLGPWPRGPGGSRAGGGVGGGGGGRGRPPGG